MSDAELQQRMARCLRALDATLDGFWERNLRTQEIWYSPAFLTMFGFAEGDLPSQRGAATARVHPDDQARFRAAYHDALKHVGRFDYEVRFLDAAGHWRWVRGRGRVWPDAQGRPEFLCGSVADVHRQTTEMLDLAQHRRELEAQVQERTRGLQAALALAEQRRQEAERANAAKSRFLAQMSHEIRTPLNGVLGLTELALRAAHSPEQRRHLETAHQSGRALLQVIDQVLDLARIEAGRVDLRPQVFDPATLLTETFRAVMPLAGSKQLAMLFDWTGDDGPLIGDATALRQIVTNLIGNAIKFTETGHVALMVEVAPDAPGQRRLTISVHDTGPGVPDSRRGRVFEAFEQADDGLARRHGGTGLGLTISQRLAQAMGGRLRLDPAAGGGSVFTVELVLAAGPDDAADAPVRRSEIAAQGLAWVVYHRDDAGRWLARRLEREGWRTEVMVGLPAALACLELPGVPRPDLVLLGGPLLAPEIDLAPLRRALPNAVMRMVIRSDWNDPALERQAAALRISPLVSPLTPTTLRGLGRSVAPAPALAEAASPAGAGAEVLLVEDNPVNQMVGQAFLERLGLRVRIAADGHAALAVLAERVPALVLMDLQMPGMDGLEATRQIRQGQQSGRWPAVPIVALTAHAGDVDRDACLAAGMDAVLTKPLSLEMLRETLGRWLPSLAGDGKAG